MSSMDDSANQVPDSANENEEPAKSPSNESAVTPIGTPGEPDMETVAGRSRSALSPGQQSSDGTPGEDTDPGVRNLGRDADSLARNEITVDNENTITRQRVNVSYYCENWMQDTRARYNASDWMSFEQAVEWLKSELEV
jgi:hypothetical protein